MKRPKFVVYEAKDGWRWRLVAANGRIIADSGEAYTRKHGCERAVTACIQAVGSIEQDRVVASLKAGSATAHYQPRA